MEGKQLLRRLSDMAGLTAREQKLLEYTFGLGCKSVLVQRQAGEIFGITRQRVQQIEREALQKLEQRSMLWGQVNANLYQELLLEMSNRWALRLGGRRKPKILRNCKRCGKAFPLSPSDVRVYCSDECRYPPRHGYCPCCGRQLRLSQREIFCSKSCWHSYRGESGLEKLVRQALESLGINFSQEGKVGHYSVDFLLPDLGVALEIDGTYWHGRPGDAESDRRKDAYLESQGYKVCRISEAEINSSDPVAVVAAALSRMDGVEIGTLQLSFA